MNVNEWGIVFAFSTGFDMQAFTSLSIVFTKPDGTELIVTDPDVSVPAVDVMTTLGLFLANHYVTYTFQDGDIDQIGLYSARVIYDDATPQHLISDIGTFEVSE